MTSQTNGQFDRTPLIAGNWKMNMDHAQAITLLQKLAWTLDDASFCSRVIGWAWSMFIFQLPAISGVRSN